MFSIQFTRNGQKDCTAVEVKVQTNLPIEKSIIPFSFECQTQYAAALLCKHLEEEYHNLIHKAHRDAYEQGFKDGRQHRKKKTWFRRKFCEVKQNPCS